MTANHISNLPSSINADRTITFLLQKSFRRFEIFVGGLAFLWFYAKKVSQFSPNVKDTAEQKLSKAGRSLHICSMMRTFFCGLR